MKNIKKYSVEDSLSTLFQNQEVQHFLRLREGLKESSLCLTGCGVDYGRNQITSLKVYHKIFEKDLTRISFFTRWFFKDFIQGHNLFRNILGNASKRLLTSRGGLGGVNFAIKAPLYSKTSRAFYIKQKKGRVKVINFNKGVTGEADYNYIFNRLLIKLLTWKYDLKLPQTRHGIEYSIRNGSLFASIYPNYKLQNEPLFNFLENLYSEISIYDPWPIENQIINTIGGLFPPNTPVTKGYVSGGGSRKIFFGLTEDMAG